MPNDQHETLAAIIQSARNRADNYRHDGWESVAEELEDLVDRIEAAAEREREAYCDLCKEKDAAYDRLLLERDKAIKASAHGNASSCAPMSLDEAIKHAEERADGSPCGQAHAQLAGWLRELRERRNAPSNAAAMREALVEVEGAIFEDEPGRFWLADAEAILHRVQAALSAPARNCDVGTAEEQIDRFHEFCHSNRIYIDEFHGYDCRPECPIGKIVDRDNKFCDNCWAAWAQMPFVPAVGGAK